MLKRLNRGGEPVSVRLMDAKFPSPFASGLEYSAPARGVFNIVHTGMLIPEIHEIFVCAQGCLRGVVLTAAEMNAQDRFSTVTIKENNLLDGDMEELLIEGVSDILGKMKKLPPAVLVYTSCIHHFVGCDLKYCYSRLRERFPSVAFTDCYMNPTMRKSGLNPDKLMRRQLYSLLPLRERKDRQISIIGNNYSTDDQSDIVKLIRKAGWTLKEVTRCNSYEEYLSMAESSFNITYNAAAIAAGEALCERLNQAHIHMPFSFTEKTIASEMNRLAEILGTDYDFSEEREIAFETFKNTKSLLGDTPIAVDYTAVLAPVGLCRLLVENGFNVTELYIDDFAPAEREDFEALKELAPDIRVYPTVNATMRAISRNSGEMLAIGQKAAYFTGTKHFVNIVESAGMYGFYGIRRIAELMSDAFLNEKQAQDCIQQKGWGCSCCL